MRIFVCTAVAVVLGLTGLASAEIPLHDLRVGIRGGPALSIISDVDENDPEPIYAGFFGVGWFIGGGLHYDYIDSVGASIEFFYSSDQGEASMEFDRDLGTDNKKEESRFTLEANALHLPIYVRGQIPGGTARPFLHVGVDLVLSRSAHALVVSQEGDAPAFQAGACTPGVDCDPFPQENFDVRPVDSQTLFLLGIGLDIDVEPVTIPIEFRGLFDFGVGNSVEDRTEQRADGVFLYDNAFEYQIWVMFGANYVIF